MILTTTQLRDILEAGGSMIIDASKMTPNQIKEMVTAVAANKASRITFKKAGQMIPRHLAALSAIAPGQVIFDLES